MKIDAQPKCNFPGCKRSAGGFLCKNHSSFLPPQLKSAVRKVYKNVTPGEPYPVLLNVALDTVRHGEANR